MARLSSPPDDWCKPVLALAEELVRVGPEHFGRRYPDPVLLHPPPEDTTKDGGGLATDALELPEEALRRGVPLNRSLLVVFVKRRVGEAAFRESIRVGRTRATDICIPYTGISKLHAYFTWDRGRDVLTVADAGSRNGTFVNGGRLPPEQPAPVQDGTIIHFGEYMFRFQMPDAFRELLQMLGPG